MKIKQAYRHLKANENTLTNIQHKLQRPKRNYKYALMIGVVLMLVSVSLAEYRSFIGASNDRLEGISMLINDQTVDCHEYIIPLETGYYRLQNTNNDDYTISDPYNLLTSKFNQDLLLDNSSYEIINENHEYYFRYIYDDHASSWENITNQINSPSGFTFEVMVEQKKLYGFAYINANGYDTNGLCLNQEDAIKLAAQKNE